MTKRADIKDKLEKVIDSKIKEVKDAKIDTMLQRNIEITDVVYLEPVIILPEDIDIDDFENAEEVAFECAQIRLCIESKESLIYYCNGSAKIKYSDNDFEIELNVRRIYSK